MICMFLSCLINRETNLISRLSPSSYFQSYVSSFCVHAERFRKKNIRSVNTAFILYPQRSPGFFSNLRKPNLDDKSNHPRTTEYPTLHCINFLHYKFDRYSCRRNIFTKIRDVYFGKQEPRSQRIIRSQHTLAAVGNGNTPDDKNMTKTELKNETNNNLDPKRFSVQLMDEEDTDIVGQALAYSGLKNGNTIFLKGDLGAGKTTLTRSFIRAYMDDPTYPVTSPSYLLDNTYSVFHPVTEEEVKIHHMDLYRLSPCTTESTVTGTAESKDAALPKQKDVIGILGFPEVTDDCLCIIEWPDRLGPLYTPRNRLEITMQVDESTGNRFIYFEGIMDVAAPSKDKELIGESKGGLDNNNNWPLQIITSLQEQLKEEAEEEEEEEEEEGLNEVDL